MAQSTIQGKQHTIKLYLIVWGWLFVLSACSYLVDYIGLHGYLRWSLILILMMTKAGLIVAVFMHMAWERLALMYAIIVPPCVLLVLWRSSPTIPCSRDWRSSPTNPAQRRKP